MGGVEFRCIFNFVVFVRIEGFEMGALGFIIIKLELL